MGFPTRVEEMVKWERRIATGEFAFTGDESTRFLSGLKLIASFLGASSPALITRGLLSRKRHRVGAVIL